MKPESIIRPLLVVLLGASALLAASCASPAPKSAMNNGRAEGKAVASQSQAGEQTAGVK